MTPDTLESLRLELLEAYKLIEQLALQEQRAIRAENLAESWGRKARLLDELESWLGWAQCPPEFHAQLRKAGFVK